jgi:hypothetical protein
MPATMPSCVRRLVFDDEEKHNEPHTIVHVRSNWQPVKEVSSDLHQSPLVQPDPEAFDVRCTPLQRKAVSRVLQSASACDDYQYMPTHLMRNAICFSAPFVNLYQANQVIAFLRGTTLPRLQWVLSRTVDLQHRNTISTFHAPTVGQNYRYRLCFIARSHAYATKRLTTHTDNTLEYVSNRRFGSHMQQLQVPNGFFVSKDYGKYEHRFVLSDLGWAHVMKQVDRMR